MYRRRRRTREIPFSFDSFLDVVANVCGIIIRLILVAWVGARSYHTLAAQRAAETPAGPPPAAEHASPEPTAVSDPLALELQRQRREMEQHEQRLLDQLRQYQQLQSGNAGLGTQLDDLTAAQQTREQQQGQLEGTTAERTAAARTAQVSLADLRRRSEQLAGELRELEKLPPASKVLRYRTPVSRPVHTEEFHFECREGRVSYIDLQAFLVEIHRGMPDKVELLKSRWEVESVTGVAGAFRLRYTLERERGVLDGGAAPGREQSFRYGLSGWVVEPVLPTRGESAEVALRPGAQFRRLADALDPEQTVVTFWVYPDSFTLYRQLRDYLYEHNVEVAGRPLPPGMPIASSRDGSASRGQ